MSFRTLKEKLLLRSKKRFIPGTTGILGFPLRYADKSSFLFMFQEIFERGIYDFIPKSSAPYIIDCGSNIGLSIIYFKKKYPNAEVLGFEPDPVIFEILKSNIEQAGLKDVTLINSAVEEKSGSLSFFQEGTDGGRVALKDDNERKITISAVTLDKYLNKPVDFLKIDIEGSEYRVLKNIKEKLFKVKTIFIEYHSFRNEAQDLGNILNILTENGFRYYIEHVGINSKNPFVKREINLQMDNQLNIFAYK